MAVRKLATVPAVKPKKPTLARRVEASVSNLVNVLEALGNAAPGDVTSQDSLEAAYLLNALRGEAEKAFKHIQIQIKAATDQGLSFEPGRFAPFVEETTGRRPKWKEVATTTAQQLATVQGVPFDEAAYVEGIQAASEKPETRVGITTVS